MYNKVSIKYALVCITWTPYLPGDLHEVVVANGRRVPWHRVLMFISWNSFVQVNTCLDCFFSSHEYIVYMSNLKALMCVVACKGATIICLSMDFQLI